MQTRLHSVDLIGRCYDNHMCWGWSPVQAVQLRAEGGCQFSLVLTRTRIVARTENVEIVNHHQGGTPAEVYKEEVSSFVLRTIYKLLYL